MLQDVGPVCKGSRAPGGGAHCGSDRPGGRQWRRMEVRRVSFVSVQRLSEARGEGQEGVGVARLSPPRCAGGELAAQHSCGAARLVGFPARLLLASSVRWFLLAGTVLGSS